MDRMYMLRSLVVLAALLGLATSASAKPLLAVLDFVSAGADVTDDELSVLGDVSRGAALETLGHEYDVITRENLVDLLKAHGKFLASCAGECETETGRLLGAEIVVSGRIVKAFGKYKVNLKVHRTDPPALLGAEMMTSDDPGGLEDAVRKGMRQIVASFAARSASSSTKTEGSHRDNERVGQATTDWVGLYVATGKTKMYDRYWTGATHGFVVEMFKFRLPHSRRIFSFGGLGGFLLVNEREASVMVGALTGGIGLNLGDRQRIEFALGVGAGRAKLLDDYGGSADESEFHQGWGPYSTLSYSYAPTKAFAWRVGLLIHLLSLGDIAIEKSPNDDDQVEVITSFLGVAF